MLFRSAMTSTHRRWLFLSLLSTLILSAVWLISQRSGQLIENPKAQPQPPTAHAEGSVATEPKPPLRTRHDFAETQAALDSITLAQLTLWLDRCGRTAETLVAAWELTKDPALEEELAAKFSNNPLVCLALLSGKDGMANPVWVERLRKAAPDHPLPDCLASAAAAREGNFEAARSMLELALGKKGRREMLTAERMIVVREAAAAAGLGEREAAYAPSKVMSNCVQIELEVSRGAMAFIKSAKSEANSGNSSTAEERAATAISLASHLLQDRGSSLIVEMFNASILKSAAKILPEDTLLGDTGGTITDAIKKDAAALEQTGKNVEQLQGFMEFATPAEITAYWDHYMQEGESKAIRWAFQRIQAAEPPDPTPLVE